MASCEEPLQLVTFSNDSEGQITVNYDVLDSVLSRTQGRPLSIICICGPSRQGKSFILGHTIRCLEAFEIDETDWMDWANKDKPLTGFKFRNGTSPETKGIWIWSKPFTVTVEDEAVSVLLLDTQGTYDEFTTGRTMTSIVGLSLLMSSSMIFNSFKTLQEDVLSSLHDYIQYGILALEENRCGEGDSSKPFQKLTFLIRDWNNPAEFPYGGKGGKEFLASKLALKNGQSPEARSIREKIQSCFDHLDCFLMPMPGDKVTAADFKGSVGELSTPFAKKMEDFISNLTSPDDLPTKTVFGSVVTERELRAIVKLYVDVFNSSEMPTPKSMLEATIHLTNQAAVEKAFKKYQEILKKHTRKIYLTEKALQKAHLEGKDQAEKLFEKQKKFGGKEELYQLEEQMDKEISTEFREIKRQTSEKRGKFIESETSEAVKSFEDDLESEFSLQDDASKEDVFYEEKKIKSFASDLQDDVMSTFPQKFEDDDEDLQEIIDNLKDKLGEVLTRILEINKIREQNAEKVVKTMVAELITTFEARMTKILGDNPFIGESDLEVLSTEMGEQCREKFQNRQLPGSKEFQKKASQVLEAALEKASTDLKTGHKVGLQKARLEADEVITKLEESYRTELEEFYASSAPLSQEDLEEFHDDKMEVLRRQFLSLSPFPESSQYFKAAVQQLLSNLARVYSSILHDLLETQRQLQEATTQAMEASFNFYHEEMTSTMKSSVILDDAKLNQENDHYFHQAVAKFDSAKPTTASESARETLISKLVDDFARLKVQNERNTELAKSEAKNLVNDCHSEYQDEMKQYMTSLKAQDKLQDAHLNAREKAVEMFKKQCKVQDPAFMEEYLTTLVEEIDEGFEEVLEIFQLQVDEEEGKTKGAILEARQFYNEEMRKEFNNNSDFLHPKHLEELHLHLANQAVAMSCAKAPLTEGQKVELMEALKESHKKFAEENDMNLEVEDVAIGIDLGTTYSCVAVYLKGKVRVIQNSQGRYTTPSYVAFQADGSEVVGEVAKDKAYENPENTIFDAKRILGRKFNDEELQEDMKLWAFNVEDDGGIPKILVRGRQLHPEEVSAKVLKALKEDAERYLQRSVKKAVITVPAYFSDGQRQATIDAGKLAGLEVLKIVPEPVAAAVAYKKQRENDGVRNVLIFDLGGGTFDVAALKMSQEKIDVLSVEGDMHLGGEDFDRNLMLYCAQEFKRQNGIDLLAGKDSDQRHLRDDARRKLKRLQGACERKKIELSSAKRVEVSVNGMHGTTDLNVVVTREQFEALNQVLFQKTIAVVEKVLLEAKLGKAQIDDIVLVGGSTRIPKIQEMLQSLFGGKSLDHSINPDEAVAYGAAMQAALVNGTIAKESIDFTKILDVQPMSIGVEVYGGSFSVIIPKNTKIPVKLQERYKTAHNNQTSVQVTVYQGENEVAARNRHLGDFYFNGIPPNAAEVENIDVEMVINSQGILHVTAVCSSTGGTKTITVTENKQRMSRAVIKRLLEAGDAA